MAKSISSISPTMVMSILIIVVIMVSVGFALQKQKELFYNDLTVNTDIKFTGGNNWIIHTPDDNRQEFFIAPSKAYGNYDWDWGKQFRIMGPDGRVIVPRLQLGGKFLFSGIGDGHADDDWLRIFNQDNKNYYGGLAAGRLYSVQGALAGSDIRLKENIENITTDKVDKLMALSPKSYVYKESPDKTRFGFIAQEVEEIFPEIVCDGPSGTKGIYYNDMIPLLLLQIQEMRKEINDLKAIVHKA